MKHLGIVFLLLFTIKCSYGQNIVKVDLDTIEFSSVFSEKKTKVGLFKLSNNNPDSFLVWIARYPTLGVPEEILKRDFFFVPPNENTTFLFNYLSNNHENDNSDVVIIGFNFIACIEPNDSLYIVCGVEKIEWLTERLVIMSKEVLEKDFLQIKNEWLYKHKTIFLEL